MAPKRPSKSPKSSNSNFCSCVTALPCGAVFYCGCALGAVVAVIRNHGTGRKMVNPRHKIILLFGGRSTSEPYAGAGDIVSGAKGFYGLAAYDAAYAAAQGPAIDLYDLTDATTQTINIKTDGMIDTDAAVTFLNGHTGIAIKLYDQTGNGHHLRNAAVALGVTTWPTFVANSGVPYLDFTPVTLSSGLTKAVTEAIAQPFTISAVLNKSSAGSSNQTIFEDASNIGLWWSDSPKLFAMYAGTAVGVDASQDAWHCVQAKFDGASSVLDIDNSSTTLNPGTTGIASGWDIAAGTRINGFVREIGIWPAGFSAGEITAMAANQAARWL